MRTITYTNSASSMYFRLRSGMSNHRGNAKLRRNVRRPSFHRYSENVPTGQSQEQNDFRSRKDIARNAINRNIPAGCTAGTVPVITRYFKFINAAIGSQPSTPAGRAAYREAPAVSKKRTQA